MELTNYFQDDRDRGGQNNKLNEEDGDPDRVDEGPLPGFRFHPTDEELVSFYLKRKVEKRPIRIELIKQVDIYKHDPWDLAKFASVGDKEWYFYCKRGRKYRNSVRPNRVTGSGFWKATGIDRPIYNNEGEGTPRQCIGLKKSLVYYRGCAGKGAKTDWMMHEFRLPTEGHHQYPATNNKHLLYKEDIANEAEIWTLCRIFKRSRKYTPDWRELPAAKKNKHQMTSSKTCSTAESNDSQEYYISFSTTGTSGNNYSSPRLLDNNNNNNNNNSAAYATDAHRHPHHMDSSSGSGFMDDTKHNVMHRNSAAAVGSRHNVQWGTGGSSSTSIIMTPQTPPSHNSTSPLNTAVGLGTVTDDLLNHFLAYGSWDDLSSVVGFAVEPTPLL